MAGAALHATALLAGPGAVVIVTELMDVRITVDGSADHAHPGAVIASRAAMPEEKHLAQAP